MDTEKIINETSVKIAALNDSFRRSMQGCTVTRGVVSLGSAAKEVFVGVRDYIAFTEDNDPYGEHDFGSLEVAGERIFWKIDYYDEDLKKWCDPLDPDCNRILTIMLAEEYYLLGFSLVRYVVELDDKQLHFGLVEIKALEFEMSIQENITREEISRRGGGVELDLSDFGYEDEYLSAYQNYLGGGMGGAVANSCTIEDWEMDEKLVRLASELRDYYDERLYELELVDEYNEETIGRLVSYPGL